MKHFLTYCLFSIILVLLSVISFSQDDVGNFFTCSGKVYDNVSQKPLNGARIAITNTERNKNVTEAISNSRGSYSFTIPSPFDIEVEVTMTGYKKAKKKVTKEELRQNKWLIPDIYLDTVIKIDFKPAAPVRQSKGEFVDRKLQSLNILPTKDAYDLLLYLNPDLRTRDSLMSNDKIILPKIPRISSREKRQNKDPFQDAKRHDGTMQNRLRDTLDKVARILGDDITRYQIKYENTNAEAMKQIRDYIRMDLVDYRNDISNTSKLKAEGLIELLSKLGQIQETMVRQRALRAATLQNIKLLWQDLSYLLLTKRYMLFVDGSDLKKEKNTSGFITAAYFYPDAEIYAGEKTTRVTFRHNEKTIAPPFFKDEVGYFGFLIWSEKLTSPTKPDLSEPGDRYLIQYFKPALIADTSRYKDCNGAANVATANLTRAKYGIRVYDTKEKRYVLTRYPDFETEDALGNSKYDAWFTPDFKEIKYITIRLQ